MAPNGQKQRRGMGGGKALSCCCSPGRWWRSLASRHALTKIHQVAVLAHFRFSIGGGSRHQHNKDPHGNTVPGGVQTLWRGGVPCSSTGAQTAVRS